MGDRRLRVWLEQQGIPHVLAVRSNDPLWATTDRGPTQVAAAQLVAQVNPEEWVRLSAGTGAKGPRIYDWVRVSIRPFAEPDQGYWLLARRSVAKPAELAYYVCFGSRAATLEELAVVASTRWAIEESFEEAKGEVGLDQYEVRRWGGWYRHITLALLAHAFLAVTRAHSRAQPGGKKGDPDAPGGATAFDGAGSKEVAMAAPLAARPPGGISPGLVPLAAPPSSQSQAMPLPEASPEIITICAAVVLEPLTKRIDVEGNDGLALPCERRS